MISAARQRWKSVCAVLGMMGVGAALMVLQPSETWVAHADPAGIKYTGAGACSAAACHGANKETEDGTTRHNENTIWSDKDPHSKAYGGESGLTNDKAKEIAKKMGIADASKEGKCLSCHSTSGLSLKEGANRIILTGADAGAKFDPKEGVSCDGCHGPASKYLEPHTTKGWTAGKRKELGSAKLYDEWGLFDTKNLKMRANTCLSCHLKIDYTMVAAGHPELPFELGDFSNPGTRDFIHWRDHGEWFTTKVWAMGQAISLREAAYQLGERAKAKAEAGLVKSAYEQMIAYGLYARQVAAVIDAGTKDKIDAHIKGIHEGWADGAKVHDLAVELAKDADALADKVNEFKYTKEMTEGFRKAVVAEAEAAGALKNFRGCEVACYSMLTLNAVMQKDAKEDPKLLEDPVGKLFEFGSIKEDFKPAEFSGAAKALGAKVSGGKALPLPAGGPQ